MSKVLKKYKNIYIFILILSLIGLSSGYIYHKVQPTKTKEELIESINIEEELTHTINNIPKASMIIIKTLLYSILIIPQLINIFNIFYKPFQIGFILNMLETYSLKFSLLYVSIYHILPLVFSLILIKISLIISKNIIELLIYKDKLSIKHLKQQLKKYLIISIIYLFYEFIIIIFSSIINSYLMTIISL